MTFDALRASSEELGIDSMKEPGSEEIALEIEPTTEDLELEKPEVPNAEDFESNDDPVRLYLHEIGRVPLLKGNDEKIAARRIEMGRHGTSVRNKLETDGKQATASHVFQEIIRELGRSSEIIHKLQKNVGYRFCNYSHLPTLEMDN